MNSSTVDVIDRGLRCLMEHLGSVETERFISTMLREKFDYTKWRQSFVDEIRTFDDLNLFLLSVKDSSSLDRKSGIIL